MALPCGSRRRWSRVVKMTFCLFFLIPMSSVGNRNTKTIFNKKQKLEVQQQLKRLNKPALKSIESPDGDIIDCVDINKQPAFDHPLLKNHTIQMRPSSYPEGFSFHESNDVSSNSEPKVSQPWHLNGRCPEGTIPIRRTKEEDLLRAGSAANYGRKKHHSIPNADSAGITHEYALLAEEGDKYYGMMANMNVWNPHTQETNEFSVSQFWIAAGDPDQDLDTIEAGITVYENLYGDHQTRLFTFWTDDSYRTTGCYNLNCPGFVQVDNQIAVGATVTPYSIYGDTQRTLEFYVYKDINGNGDWWLKIAQRNFGYWPSSLFSLLSDSASSVQWGGEVTNLKLGEQHTTTQMGSGHFPEEGPGKASYFDRLNVIDGKTVLRGPRNSHTQTTNPNCYNIINYGDHFYYGGPGRNPNCP
uniref:Neprosin PEP catalytic domain-containing protein n=2 Tax=Quercus lobata TaxID=97700 RepID=A0A7N2LDJ1_QUELO